MTGGLGIAGQHSQALLVGLHKPSPRAAVAVASVKRAFASRIEYSTADVS